MAKLRQAKTHEEITHLTVGKVRREYEGLAEDYNRLIEQKVLLCPKCNEYKTTVSTSEFYRDTRWAIGFFPICKDCLKLMAEQRTSHRQPSKECKESVQKVLRLMDRAYVDSWYEQCVRNVTDNNAEAGVFDEHPSAFASYIRGLATLPQFNSYRCWEDSDFGDTKSIDDDLVEDAKIVKATVKAGRKRFGDGYSDQELMFLENEYQDWVSRYECSTKAQELVFQSIALTTLQRDKSIRAGKPTKDLDKTIQDWLDTGNLKPKQNNMDAFSDAQTMGTLIQKYEDERPLPKVDPSHEDVEHWGMYIDAFYRGHSCKMFGVKNKFSNIYEKVMQKFTVSMPEYSEEEDTETVFDKIFGGSVDGET